MAFRLEKDSGTTKNIIDIKGSTPLKIPDSSVTEALCPTQRLQLYFNYAVVDPFTLDRQLVTCAELGGNEHYPGSFTL